MAILKLPEQASNKYGIKARPFTGQVSNGCALGSVVWLELLCPKGLIKVWLLSCETIHMAKQMRQYQQICWIKSKRLTLTPSNNKLLMYDLSLMT